MDGLVALGTIFIPGLAEVKDLPQAAIAKGGFEKPRLLLYDNVMQPKVLHGATPHAGA